MALGTSFHYVYDGVRKIYKDSEVGARSSLNPRAECLEIVPTLGPNVWILGDAGLLLKGSMVCNVWSMVYGI